MKSQVPDVIDHPFKLRDTEERDKILLGILALNLPFL